MTEPEPVAAELTRVRSPWDRIPLEREAAARLTPADVPTALDSLAACLEFLADRSGEVEAARRNVPELADTYWLGFRDDLVEAMPTMGDLTWPKFTAWADAFDPAWLGLAWERPPPEFVHAGAWLWTFGVVDSAARGIDEWLVATVQRGSPPAGRLLELAVAHLARVGEFGSHLVWAVAETGGMDAVRRLGTLPGLSDDVRAALERAPDFIRLA